MKRKYTRRPIEIRQPIFTWVCSKCGWANDNNLGPCRKCGHDSQSSSKLEKSGGRSRPRP